METGNLVVTRKAGEVIEIDGGRIVITVVEIRADKARISVQAPRDMPVHRGEIAELIRKEQDAHDRQA